MSKEQTLIEKLRDDIQKSYIISDETKLILSAFDWEELLKKEQEHLNAKVLEALEREFSEVAVDWGQLSMMNGKEYYETEVKPKYDPEN